jgi:hypothetical protein
VAQEENRLKQACLPGRISTEDARTSGIELKMRTLDASKILDVDR